MKIYTASSWRNERYPRVVKALHEAGFEVYDFRNPPDKKSAFNWNQIDPTWTGDKDMIVNSKSFIQGMFHPIAQKGFISDYNGMLWADACVLILPCGNSAHMEAGWMLGRNKPVWILLDTIVRPELTYSLSKYRLCTTVTEVINDIKRFTPK